MLQWPYAYGINLFDRMCPHQEAAFLMDRSKDGALCYRSQSPICGASLLWSKYTDLEIKELGEAPFKTRTLDNPLSDFFTFLCRALSSAGLVVLLPKKKSLYQLTPSWLSELKTRLPPDRSGILMPLKQQTTTVVTAGWGNRSWLPQDTRVGATQLGQAGPFLKLRASLGSLLLLLCLVVKVNGKLHQHRIQTLQEWRFRLPHQVRKAQLPAEVCAEGRRNLE